MSDTVIKVENLSKQYRLGEVGTGTLAHDLNRWWHNIRGKEDPYLKIGEENNRASKGTTDYVWALREINFEVKQGEVLGIIGRNGAGKSTLLKILSRTTTPTTGSVKVKGRVASLLEVGTGFHPELSGRDNIFLNGAILGMTKAEIKSKFDEIVDFAGVERYIDTPVKRYSSGMYVRLAFAVAAHLDPEILIVDEVLAVGDAEFQKKALGKMRDISKGEGRTVLFVSHNLASIRALCNKGILLINGGMDGSKSIEQVLVDYSNQYLVEVRGYKVKYFSNYLKVCKVYFNDTEITLLKISAERNQIDVKVLFELTECLPVSIEMKMYDRLGSPIAFISPYQECGEIKTFNVGSHEICVKFDFPRRANRGVYRFDLWLSHPGVMQYAGIEQVVLLEYEGYSNNRGNTFDYDKGAGFLFLEAK